MTLCEETLSQGVTAQPFAPAHGADPVQEWPYYLDILVTGDAAHHFELHALLIQVLHSQTANNGLQFAISYPDMELRRFSFGPALRVFAKDKGVLQAIENELQPLVERNLALIRTVRSTPPVKQYIQFYRYRRKAHHGTTGRGAKRHSLHIGSHSTGQRYYLEIDQRSWDAEENGALPAATNTGGASYGLGHWVPDF